MVEFPWSSKAPRGVAQAGEAAAAALKQSGEDRGSRGVGVEGLVAHEGVRIDGGDSSSRGDTPRTVRAALDFAQLVGRLKTTPRSGWGGASRQVRPQLESAPCFKL